MKNDIFKSLYSAVLSRPRPEDVAELILCNLNLSLKEKAIIDRAAKHSLKRSMYAYSSMNDEFESVKGPRLSSASVVFNVQALSDQDCLDPVKVKEFIDLAAKQIGSFSGDHNHMNKAERKANGIYKCQRWYNKRWKFLRRLDKKLVSLIKNNKRYECARVSKSLLATKISYEDFSKDLNSAALIAYLSSRMSLRSVFTNGSQARAFDEICETLLQRCLVSGTSCWYAIAHVLPNDKRVIGKLSEEEKGKLLGMFFNMMKDMTGFLKEVASGLSFSKEKMIVKRGDDSTTWNQVAGAWNKTLEAWQSILHAMGMEGILKEMCPGKVMRLMAADIAYWHNDIHPDTFVWANLPYPWEVLNGTAICTYDMVKNACEKHNVNVQNWVKKSVTKTAFAYSPTPELVHGVSVSSPYLASVLKKNGYFSGKALKEICNSVDIVRDEQGFVIGANEVNERVC